MSQPPVVELLGSHHDKPSFSCGEASLDDYLKRYARQDVRRRQSTVFVLCSMPGDAEILGYYTLASASVVLTSLPENAAGKLPYPEVPATLLGRLAVASRHFGKGYGSYMLVDAAARAMAPGAPASWAMLVDPIDEAAAGWYARFGFMPLETDGGARLFLPLATFAAARRRNQ